jgi:hypothetical protein
MLKLSILFLGWGLGISTALVVYLAGTIAVTREAEAEARKELYIFGTVSIISLALLIMGVTSALRYADQRHEADVARYHRAEMERDYEKARANDAEDRAETCSKYVKERKGF